MMKKLLCAGPTTVSPEVQKMMGTSLTNPDLDPNYLTFHRNVEAKVSKLANTKATSIIMLGEAIMGNEAACSALTEPGDRALIIYNGFFGEDFKNYVTMFGGEAVLLPCDMERGVDPLVVENFLNHDDNFKFATLVHCETPSGITNDIGRICPILKKHGILSVVDSVSGLGGEYVDFDGFNIDILVGGTQKCLSAPTGLTLVTISDDAKAAMENRHTPIPSFYINLLNHMHKTNSRDFPYTMNENLVYALDKALDRVLSHDFVTIHADFADKVRKTLTGCGLQLYPKDSFANTVTALRLPEGINDRMMMEALFQKNIIISGGVGHISGTTIRLGHMGSNIDRDNFTELFGYMDDIFAEFDFKLSGSLAKTFVAQWQS